MKKLFALLLTFSLLCATGVIAYGEAAEGSVYTDLKASNWAYKAVTEMSDADVVKGYPDGSFKPSNTVTYGEFIKMALIADTGKDVGNAESGNWAMNYYNAAVQEGYFTQYEIHSSQMNNQIPRSDMALIISDILGDSTIDNYDKIQAGITDVDATQKYEYDIIKSYSAGILTGYEDNTFRPKGTLTRAEAATVIYRLINESARVLPGVKEETPAGELITEVRGIGDGQVTHTIHYQIVDTADYVDVSTAASTTNSGEACGNFTTKAELCSASDWDFMMNRDWDKDWGCSFDHTMGGFIYLVKDDKMVEYCNTTPKYDEDGNFLYYYRSMTGEKGYDVTKADYIMAVPTDVKSDSDKLIKIVPNPFK